MHHLSRPELATPTISASIRRNSAWMLASRVSRALVAALYFAMLARSLGVGGYGAFTGVCALAGILAPFASLGSGNLLVQEVSRDRTCFAPRWGYCLLVTGVSGMFFTAVAVLLARFLLPRSIMLALVFAIAIADLIFVRLLDVSAMAFQAIEQLPMTAWFSFSLTLSRMFAAALLVTRSHATPADWSCLYLISTVIPACAAAWIVCRQIGAPVFHVSLHVRELLLGFYFSVSLSAQTIYNDIDKTMLARITGLPAAGLYGAAYRIVDAAFTPVNALLSASYARFFQHGAKGLHSSARFGRHLASRSAAYSLLASIFLWFAAPWVPRVLGPQFAQTTPALRLLAPLLLLRSTHCFAADSLTGAGHQLTRTVIQVAVAAANVLSNLAILPRYGWRGAVWTSLACDATLALTLWTAVGVLCTRQHSTNEVPALENAAAEA